MLWPQTRAEAAARLASAPLQRRTSALARRRRWAVRPLTWQAAAAAAGLPFGRRQQRRRQPAKSEAGVGELA